MALEDAKKTWRSGQWYLSERIRVHAALLTVQLGYGGYYVLSKYALSDGVNRFVFAVYRDSIALAFLAPYSFFYERRQRPAYTLPVLALIVGLGFTGIFLQQTLFLAGLSYTNSAFAASMQNAIPVFTFLIAVVCGVEVIRIKKVDGIAKLCGIFACIAGATTMSLYRGPTVLGKDPQPNVDPEVPVGTYGYQRQLLGPEWGMLSALGVDQWQLGALCLVANCFCMGVYTNLQVPALRRFPAPMSLTACSIFVGTIGLVITGLLTVSNESEWVLNKPGNILSVAYAGLIASGLNFTFQTWANHRGGPVIVAAYIPLQTVFSAILGLVVLGEALYLGTVLGAVLILTGLYLVVWGQRAHKYSQELQAALPFSAVIGDENDTKEPLLPETEEHPRQ